MGMPAAVRHRWTAQEVRKLQHRSWPRYELIDGELYVTSSPEVRHQRLVAEVLAALRAFFQSLDFAEVLTSPSDIELEEESVLQPDVFVFPRISAEIERPSWKEIRSLYLAVEVISPSSVRTDRVIKRDEYMRMAVDEYWVVDPDGRQIERWFRDRPNVEVARETLAWQLRGAAEPLTIDVEKLLAADGLPQRL
jgi:Uma2 family endonuclease